MFFSYVILESIEKKRYLKGKVVSPSTPRERDGLYWGYNVRLADHFGAIFTDGPYKNGYDLTLGTSERGVNVDELELPTFKYVAWISIVS